MNTSTTPKLYTCFFSLAGNVWHMGGSRRRAEKRGVRAGSKSISWHCRSLVERCNVAGSLLRDKLRVCLHSSRVEHEMQNARCRSAVSAVGDRCPLEMPSSLGMAIQLNARNGRGAEKVHKIWDKTTGTLQPPGYIGEGHVLRFSTVLREREREQ